MLVVWVEVEVWSVPLPLRRVNCAVGSICGRITAWGHCCWVLDPPPGGRAAASVALVCPAPSGQRLVAQGTTRNHLQMGALCIWVVPGNLLWSTTSTLRKTEDKIQAISPYFGSRCFWILIDDIVSSIFLEKVHDFHLTNTVTGWLSCVNVPFVPASLQPPMSICPWCCWCGQRRFRVMFMLQLTMVIMMHSGKYVVWGPMSGRCSCVHRCVLFTISAKNLVGVIEKCLDLTRLYW